ncbi:MAG: hypothetical protein AAF810_05350 [Cyanobacteria bacterium P01_D01_bin.36]
MGIKSIHGGDWFDKSYPLEDGETFRLVVSESADDGGTAVNLYSMGKAIPIYHAIGLLQTAIALATEHASEVLWIADEPVDVASSSDNDEY